jgi:hypothetical protein
LSKQRSRLAVTILLLVSTVLVSVASIANLPSVEAAATITLNPTYAGIGAVVTFTGSGFSYSNATTTTLNPTSCQLSSLDGVGTADTLISSPFCTITSGGSVSGSFVVSGTTLPPIINPYTVIVKAVRDASHYIIAQKTFTVTSIFVKPTHGTKGTIVVVNGSISSTSTTCSLSGTPVGTPSCAMISSGGNFNGSFIVRNVGPGPYTITVTGGGVSVQTTFTVDATTPTIKLYPPLGNPGTTVIAAQNYTGVVLFPATDTSCSISGTGSVVTSGTCTVATTVAGSNVTASFKVGNVAAGTYSITVTGSPSGLKASALFTVTNPFVPTIVVVPSDGPSGTLVAVSGTGFSTSDTTCQLTSTGTGADPLLITLPSCTVSGGTLTGKFTVGSGASVGLRAVNATGNTGDKAHVNFNVTASPVLIFYKAGAPTTSGYPGDAISVNVTATTRFSSGDTSCTMSSSPTGLFASSICVIHAGKLDGTYFTIAGTANGAYAVTVKGNLGDSATAVFTVKILPSLVLTPSSGPTGTTVAFRATGFSITDTGCVVQSGDGSTNPPSLNMLLITSPTCTISSPQVATGSFIVGPTATTNVKWNVTVKGTPANDEGWHTLVGESALFNVTAKISVVPTTGTNGTVVTVSGSGFSSLATFCNLTVVPNNTFVSATCGVAGSTGHVSGSFIVFNAPPGTYLVNVKDSTDHFAGATFTVGSPNATISIVPNVAKVGDSVGIVGNGFNPSDTYCTTTTTVPTVTTPTCSISGGVVGGSFTISSSAIPGYYVVVVSATPYGDFASNFLFVAVITGTVTTSTSTTTSVTTTTATSITTSIPVTLTTTTMTNTGVSTDRSVTITTTTITGQSTSSISTTTTTTSVVTSSTSTTVSTMITTTAIYGQAVSGQMTTPSSVDGNLFGLVSIMALLGLVLFRRWAL